ncbi:alpha-ketoglutarate-dependent dioxygenase AlkB [Actinocorallia sp. API 0066]|uniref:alpha-ketoglutarate-dependent dioxygenase AlkB n=1 Tax=Actinocorallia sp. API 0066 TaxID=2896846 RepID=UPI001E523EF6|nr:alpha-ketoglutarate-dependent dioxygenase AlkB [Actinocorallia sp. API 0066]MCD0449065.1 alpha-ketoglutarate-dependent dioxygenase AlkB [Actinocorallia sp. API 0066]
MPNLRDEILSYALPTNEDLFAELSTSAHLEDVGKGRRGAVLTRIDETGNVPLVRTTTRYNNPTQRFRPIHERLAQQIQTHAGLPASFNNALIENYTDTYRTMGSHSDQALDLADDSFIAVFSCYSHPEASPPRKLIFEPKEPTGEQFTVPLTHNSVIIFSIKSNQRLRHKIILSPPVQTNNQWLGLTFRTSKTLIQFHNKHPHLPQGTPLTLANNNQSQELYTLRRRENTETTFTYPPLTYTLSQSDLIPPT